jgi:hypothetical protein
MSQLFMADVREVNDQATMPIVYVQNGETQLCIGMPLRAANLMIAYNKPADNASVGKGEEDTDRGEPPSQRLLEHRRRRGSGGNWVCDFESTLAFPLLEWTHVTVEIEWQAPPASSDAPEDCRPSVSVWFGSEDVSITISSSVNRRPRVCDQYTGGVRVCAFV